MPDGNLTINCVINVMLDAIDNYGRSDPVPNCDLAKDLGVLLDSKELCDVTIKTNDGHELRAHKIILSGKLEFKLCSMGLFIKILFFPSSQSRFCSHVQASDAGKPGELCRNQ